jgi:uncharacterized protein Yka (UPF0111/DUF47 family)
MFKFLLPKEYSFYDFFEKHAEVMIETCKELVAFSSGKTDPAVSSKKIKDFEHEADDITHHCTEALLKTFITPLERTDIHLLIKRMDDIVDAIDAGVSRASLYEIKSIRPEAQQLAEVLLKASNSIYEAVKSLRNTKDTRELKERLKLLHALENEGDIIHRSAIVNLFKETDAVLIIKWKEIFDRLERAIDRCEDVANIIEGVVISSS